MKEPGVRILLVEDEAGHVELVRRAFESAAPQVILTVASTLRQARTCLGKFPPDLLIADLLLPDGPGTDLLPGNGGGQTLPTVVMTSFGNEQAAVEAMQAGALDYVVKSETSLADMPHIAERALQRWEDVTQRRRAEKALRESEERFRLMYEQSPLAYQSLNARGRLIEVNPAWLETLGYSRDEVIGRSFADFLAPEYVDRFRQNFPRFKEAGETYGVQFEMVCKDGSRITVEIDGRTGRDEQGNFKQTHCIVRDVTEQKLAEEALRYRAEFERLITGLSSEFVQLGPTEVDAGIQRAMQAIGQFADVDRSYVFLLRDDGATVDNTHEWCAADIEPQIDNLQGISLDNELPWLAPQFRKLQDVYVPAVAALPEEASLEKEHFQAQDIQSLVGVPMVSGGRLKGFLGFDSVCSEKPWSQDVIAMLRIVGEIFVNCLERKHAEEALRNSEEKFRGIAERSFDAIFMADCEGNFTYTSPAVEKILGYRPDEVVGNQFTKFLAESEIPRVLQRFEEAMRGEFTEILGIEVVKKDGSHAFLEVSHSRILQQGNAVGIQGLLRDVSERKRAEEQLAKAKQAAEAANRAKSEFLANMSHEIRTPMTAVLGYAGLLTDPKLSPAVRQDHAQTILKNGELLLELINDILDLSKIEAGKMAMQRTDCPVFEILEDAERFICGRAEEKGLDLIVDCEFPLPETVFTDPTRLRQILLNLLGNAVKFTERGEVRLTVRCVAEDAAPMMELTVADTGIGISPQDLAGLFSPFTQADASTTRRFGGTGLGLTISKRLAEKLGGDIRVQSELGAGSTFTLTVDPGPLRGVTMLEQRPKQPQQQPGFVDVPQALRGRVLLAEDALDVQQLIRFILEQAGLQVETAGNGQVAYEKAIASAAEAAPYDLILMDIQMPEIDGYEVTLRLRDNGWHRPIIALTAHAMAGDREKCLKAGCDDYVPKPINRSTLLGAVARCLGQTAAPADGRDAGDSTAPLISTIADHPILAELLGEFVAELPLRAKKIDAALKQGNLRLLGQLAHQLNGAAGIYGFAPIAEKALKVNEQVESGDDLQRIEPAVDELVGLCRRAADGRDP